jgi:hypothetical protein
MQPTLRAGREVRLVRYGAVSTVRYGSNLEYGSTVLVRCGILIVPCFWPCLRAGNIAFGENRTQSDSDWDAGMGPLRKKNSGAALPLIRLKTSGAAAIASQV